MEGCMVVLKNIFTKTVKAKKRVARSGCRGGTSGRGHKGYKARSGSVVKGFEGGQTPIYRRLPMRGFNSNKCKAYTTISLKRVLSFVENGTDSVDHDVLVNNGVIKNTTCKVKLIGSDVNKESLKKLKRVSLDLASNGVVNLLKENNVELVLKNN